MVQISWHFLVGMIVSFIGSIPLGSVNISTLQVTVEKNARAGIVFALGATLVELIYSFIAIRFSGFILANHDVEFYIQLVAIPAFIALSIHSFRKKPGVKNTPSASGKSSFMKGVIIGLVNPLQIPFWVAYGTYLLSQNWIENDSFYLNWFVLGIICGTFLLLSLIVLLSKVIQARMNLDRVNLNKVIGTIFFLMAIWQIFNIAI